MTKTEPAHSKSFRESPQQFPFQGAIIDAEGREIPITEGMIREACRRLENASSSIYPRRYSADPRPE